MLEIALHGLPAKPLPFETSYNENNIYCGI